MWKKNSHVFFQNVVYQRVASACFGIFYPLPVIQLTKSSLPGVVWPWSLVCHCGWVWFYMKAQLSWWPGSLAFRWWFRADFFGMFTSKIGEMNKWTKLTHILQICWNHQLVGNFNNDGRWVSNFGDMTLRVVSKSQTQIWDGAQTLWIME